MYIRNRSSHTCGRGLFEKKSWQQWLVNIGTRGSDMSGRGLLEKKEDPSSLVKQD